MTEIESVVEPDYLLDDFKWKSMALVQFLLVHARIITWAELTCQYLQDPV